MKSKQAHRKPKKQQNIASQRIKDLFEQAKLRSKTRPDLAKRYVTLARKIGMKYKTPIPRLLKRQFCKKCLTYWVPGRTCSVRLRNQTAITRALNVIIFLGFVTNSRFSS